MKKTLLIILFPLLIGLACNFPGLAQTEKTATPLGGVEATIMALAVGQTQTAMASQSAPTVSPPTNTPEPLPTIFIPTLQPTSGTPSTATKQPKPCNAASYVADLTYEDGTKVPAGTTFIKKWRLSNVGTCTWDGTYQLVFSSGDRLNAPDAVDLDGINIAPGMTMDVSVQLKAPVDPGTYRANFLLKSGDGVIFGIGNSAAEVFWAEIKVAAPTSAPSPKADIYISAYTICAAQADVPCEIKVTVYNQGDKVSGPYQVQFFQSDSAPAGCTWNSNNNPGGGEVLSCMYTFPSPYVNLKTRVVVDTGNVVVESDEGNNVKYKTIDVAP